MKILLKNGKFFENGQLKNIDLMINGAFYQILDEKKQPSDCQEFDLKGATIFPGFVDMQVHFREPGLEYKEDLATGSMAAVKGGFCTVATMPNTQPTLDDQQSLLNYLFKIETKSNCRIYPMMAMTKGLKGKDICDFKMYKDHHILGVTDDGIGVENDEIMDQVFQKASENHLSVLQHCEYQYISQHAPVHGGLMASSRGYAGSSSSSEWKMIERDIKLLQKYGGHYHALHLSCRESVDLIAEAKAKGLNITSEVTPHHLLLCDEDIPWDEKYKTNFKMNPPLRTKKDRQALVQGFADGVIDIISTDHAPHSVEEKNNSLEKAPYGVIGLETAFPLLYTYLVLTQQVSLDRLIDGMSTRVHKIFNLPHNKPQLADLSIVDLDSKQTIERSYFYSKSENSPFMNWEVNGEVKMTVINGEIKYNTF